MASEPIGGIVIEIEATTNKAEKGIDKTIESLKAMQTALNGINTKKLKQDMESFEDFQKKLQSAFSNIQVSGNFLELQKQITQAEAKLDTLLAKENKLATVSGIDENSKQYRSLQYDMAKTCATLDRLYEAMEKVNAQKPLNFWERPDWNATPEPEATPVEGATVSVNVSEVEEATTATERLSEAVDKVGTTTEQTTEKTSRFDAVLGKLSGVAQSIHGAFSRVRDTLGSGANTEKFNQDMQELIDGINQAKYTMKEMENGNKAFDSEAYENAARGLADANARLQAYKSSLTQATEQTSRFKTIMSGLGSAFRGVFSMLGKVGQGAIKAFKTAASAIKSLKGKLPSLGSAFTALGKKIQSVTRLFTFMVLRRAITALLNSVKEGFDNLARYSAAKGTEFNKNISAMQSALKTLGNSIVTAFEPLINAVAPILTAFINKLTQATNAIAQFFAALTGKKTWTKAKTSVTDYAKGLDKATAATKKLANATLGIDELNILQSNEDDNSGGADNGGGGADGFTTEEVGKKWQDLADMIKKAWEDADFSEIGAMLARAINNWMESIDWEAIKAGAEKIAKCIGTFINGFVGELDWTLLGYTIAQGINTAFVFANTLLKTIDWSLLGSSISEGLNSIVDNLDWQLIGETIYNAINAAIDFCYELVNGFDFTKFGESIGSMLTTAIGGIKWDKGGATIGKAITGLFKAIKGFIDKTDWKSLGKGITTAIGSFFTNVDWSSISGSLSSAFIGLCNLLQGAIEGVDWSDVPRYIVDSIGDFFKGFDWSGMSKSLGSLLGAAVKAAIKLGGSIWDMLKEAWGDMTSYFSEYIEEAGGNVVEGIFKGITDAIKGVGTWIKENLFQPFIDGFKEAFGIHSPSKEMATMGGYIVDGLISGIGGKFSDCMSKVKEWAQNVKDWFYGKGTTIKDKFKEYGGDVVTAFKDKIGTTYTNCRDTIAAWTKDLKDRFTGSSYGNINKTNWAEYANEVVTGFKDKVANVYTTCRDTIATWTKDLKDRFTGSGYGNINGTNWGEYANDVVSGFKTKVNNVYTTCRDAISTWTTDLKDRFTGSSYGNINGVKWATYADDVVKGFKNKVSNVYTECRTAISTWTTDLKDRFSGSSYGDINGTRWGTYAYEVVKGFKNKIGDTYTEARANMQTFGKAVKGWFEKPEGDDKPSLVSRFTDIGKNIIQGFIDGVNSLWDKAMEKIKKFGQSVIAKGKEGTDEHSPSKAFKQIGEFVIEGFNIGIEKAMGSSFDLISEWADTITSYRPTVGFALDTTTIDNYKPNYGEDFESENITRTIQKEVVASGSISLNANAESGRDINTTLEAIRDNTEALLNINTSINSNTDRMSKKDTNVYIGNKRVADAVNEAREANGFSFAT